MHNNPAYLVSQDSQIYKPGPDGKFNVVFLLADDLRFDSLGVSGNPVIHTPNLDQLARDGVFFENAFVTTSICPSSRASISTGQYASRHKIWGFDRPLPSNLSESLHKILRKNEYQTCFIGKWGLGGKLPVDDWDQFFGFSGQGNYFDQSATHLSHRLKNHAVDFLQDKGNQRKPFFLQVSFKSPHAQDGHPEVFLPPGKFEKFYADQKPIKHPSMGAHNFENLPLFLRESEGRLRFERRLLGEDRFRQTILNYYRLVSGLDGVIGDILQCLRDQNLIENTLIVFASDNGLMLGEHGLFGKWWMFEESIRIPLLFKLPRAMDQGPTYRKDMGLNIDIAPTILDLLGFEVPKTMQGRRLFSRTSSRDRKYMFYEHLFEGKDLDIAKSVGVRTSRWKYIQFLESGPQTEMLFNLKNDPYETRNLINSPEYSKIAKHLRKICQISQRSAL